MIPRMLTELVEGCIAIKPIPPAGIMEDIGCYLLPRTGIHNDGPHGICAEIYAYTILIIGHICTF